MLSNDFWSAIHEREFIDCKETMKKAVEPAYPKENHVMSKVTKDSDKLWSCEITQSKERKEDKRIPKQEHKSLPFLRG